MASSPALKTPVTSPARKVTAVNKQPVAAYRVGPGTLSGGVGGVIGKQSGPTASVPSGAGLVGGGGFFTPRPPTASENLPGWIGYALSDPLNQGTYRDAQTGEVTAAGNLPDQISGAVEKAARNLGVDLQTFLIEKGGWIVAFVVVIGLMLLAGQSFLRGS